jgi:protoporphyrinogen/coproporphyrinogen III oxidase
MSARAGTLVVGAGISGLAYAHARGNADLLVLEASERAGGLIRTERGGERGEFRFECGPEALRFERDGELTRMLSELGLEALAPPESASKRFVCWNQRLYEVPLAPPRLLASPLLTLRGKLRLASEPWRDARVGLDGSIADFVRHRIGREALERMIDPLVSGIHAGDPEELSLRACFPRMAELVETHGSLIRALRATRGSPAPSVMKPGGGNSSIVTALVRTLGSKLRLNAPVHSMEFDGSTWTVSTPNGMFESPRLVLALPSAAAARLLGNVAPELARAIGSIQAESVASVALAYRREDVAHSLDGFGYLVASKNGFAHLGTLFSSSIDASCCPPDTVLLRVMLGGARHPEVVEWDDARLMTSIEREVGPLLGLRGKPRFVAFHRWRAALPRFDLQHPARVAAIERSVPPGLNLLGNYLGGIGVNHLVDVARRAARTHASAEQSSAVARSSR